jgi:hypothetical protein
MDATNCVFTTLQALDFLIFINQFNNLRDFQKALHEYITAMQGWLATALPAST